MMMISVNRIVPKAIRSLLYSQDVFFLVNTEGFDKNKLEKSRMEKTPVLKKKQNSNGAC